MKISKFIYLTVALFAMCNIFAQDDELLQQDHKFGFNFGSTSGIGFSYKYQPSKFGLQIVAIPILDEGGDFLYSTGFSFLYRFSESRKFDAFGYIGNHIENIGGSSDFGYHLGIGVGLDFHVWRNVLDLNLQFGYGIYYLNDRPFSLPAAEFGVHYRFGGKANSPKMGGM